MLRHTGEKRTYAHNVKLAALLSLTAGSVNAAGYLSFTVYTTNVTGHVALFAEKIAAGDLDTALVTGTWMLMFLLGSFTCGLIINTATRFKRSGYVLPAIVELVILLLAANDVHVFTSVIANRYLMAGSLLFAMGLQNAMVSMISGSVVRTTHLTGMFTDLGIELAWSLSNRSERNQNTLGKQKMILRLIIIASFFGGCILSACLFHQYQSKTFYFPVTLLLISVFFDAFRINTIRLYRKAKQRLPRHAE